MSVNAPTVVLSQAVADAIAGRRVRSAVFTTFSFDPGFFEINVLPVLFDRSFSQVDKVRLIQLEDALRGVDSLAVYYDRNALAQDGEPARLDYRRIDVRRAAGVFHPKLILLLVESLPEEPDEAPVQSVLVGVLSANLTRAGWWENVECGHVEEIAAATEGDERLSFRKDLLGMVRRLRDCAEPGADHSALETIRRFLLTRAPRRQYVNASAGGRYHTRLFGGLGDAGFADWLGELGLGRRGYNLEIISPYFDGAGAQPLQALRESLAPREVRVCLPTDADGEALVSRQTYAAVVEAGGVWSTLPGELIQRGRSEQGERLAPRRVHAKVYRLWRRGEGAVVVVGSVNLTRSAHSHGGAGNLEAAFLVDAGRDGSGWWLKPLESEVDRFAEDTPREDEGLTPAPIDLSLRFDWGTGRAEYRMHGGPGEVVEVTTLAGIPLFGVESGQPDAWTPLGEEAAAALREHLRSSSFVRLVRGEREWRVLVREEGMAHRPSLLTELTPEEVLEYWSLLTEEQRSTFIEEVGGAGALLEGLQVRRSGRLGTGNTLFDRYAGVYHAFGCFRRHLTESLAAGRWQEAEARLLGAKYDSLPVFLDKCLNSQSMDAIVRYVTFLSARQLCDAVQADYPAFFSELDAGRVQPLASKLAQLPEVRASVGLGEGEQAFLEWFEPLFLKDLARVVPPDAHDND